MAEVLGSVGTSPSPTDGTGGGADRREQIARMAYELDPAYEGGEFLDGLPISPGGYLSWEQAHDRDAEFGLGLTAGAYEFADRVLSLAPSAEELGRAWRTVWDALGFFASAIRSGEDWTDACELVRADARDALRVLRAIGLAPEARSTADSSLSAEGVRDAGEASGQPTEPSNAKHPQGT